MEITFVRKGPPKKSPPSGLSEVKLRLELTGLTIDGMGVEPGFSDVE